MSRTLKQIGDLGIILYDVKPDNMMVTNQIDSTVPINSEKLKIVLIDFGLAKQLQETCSQHFCKFGGSPEYVCHHELTNSKYSSSFLFFLTEPNVIVQILNIGFIAISIMDAQTSN